MKLKNDSQLVAQLLSERFTQARLHPRQVAQGGGLSTMGLMWLTHAGRSRLNRREIEALRQAFGDEFATALQAAVGYTVAQFARQNKEGELQAQGSECDPCRLVAGQ